VTVVPLVRLRTGCAFVAASGQGPFWRCEWSAGG